MIYIYPDIILPFLMLLVHRSTTQWYILKMIYQSFTKVWIIAVSLPPCFKHFIINHFIFAIIFTFEFLTNIFAAYLFENFRLFFFFLLLPMLKLNGAILWLKMWWMLRAHLNHSIEIALRIPNLECCNNANQMNNCEQW